MKVFLEIYTCHGDRYHFVKYCIIYNQHGNVVWHHVCFGHGNNRKKEFCNDARLKRNVG